MGREWGEKGKEGERREDRGGECCAVCGACLCGESVWHGAGCTHMYLSVRRCRVWVLTLETRSSGSNRMKRAHFFSFPSNFPRTTLPTLHLSVLSAIQWSFLSLPLCFLFSHFSPSRILFFLHRTWTFYFARTATLSPAHQTQRCSCQQTPEIPLAATNRFVVVIAC